MTWSLVSSMFRALLIVSFVGTLGASSPLLGGTSSAVASASVSHTTSFTLDGVTLDLSTPFLLSHFVTPPPSDGSQVATATSLRLYQEVSVTAVPYGSRPGTEALPPARSGGAAGYLATLRGYRLQQGARPGTAPAVKLFGRWVPGIVSLARLHVDGTAPKPVLIAEWVADAGNRLWIVRVSQEGAGAGSVSGLSLASSTLDRPSSSEAALLTRPVATRTAAPGATASSASDDLPTPTWWNGSDCDGVHYASVAGRASYRLGAVYRGMPACGPRPWFDNASDVMVHFYSGAWGENEWECVELAMRYLYLAYGIVPYGANGSQVVWNYSGTALQKIANGTAGTAPQPGDVLSYGSTSSYGHTSIVTSSSVDGNGNGSIAVIEQNAAVSGSTTLTVSAWSVAGNAGSVSGWLHQPGGSQGQGVAITAPANGSYNNTGSITLTGTATPNASVSILDSGASVATAVADPSGGWNATLSQVPDGAHTYQAQATDAGGLTTVSGTVTVTVDTVAPVARAPVQSLVKGSTLGTDTIPITLRWSGTDSGSGVASYQVQKSVDGGAWTWVSSSTTSTSSVRQLYSGHAYAYQVRVLDRAGNSSAWSSSPRLTATLDQETSSAVAYTGSWTAQQLSNASSGAVQYAAVAGATATYTFTGRSVAWVAPRGADRGQATIYLDGASTPSTTVDLYSSTALPRQMVYVKSWSTSGPHTLRVVVTGTSGRPRVDIDAFVVLR